MGRTIIIKEKISVMISVNRRLNSCLIYFTKPWKGQAGSALLGLIVTMVFLSALAAAMIAQTTTGSLGFVNENSSLRAYYLAESGFRYAAAKLKNEGESALDTLHKHGPYSIEDYGCFTIKFKTYIFDVDNVDVANELVTKVPFGDASSLADASAESPLESGQYFYVKTKSGRPAEAVNSIVIQDSGGTPDPNGEYVKFIKDSGKWLDTEYRVKLVVKSNGVFNDPKRELYLLPSSPAYLFPLYNGRFEADDKIYQYKKRETDKLVGITRVDSSTWEAPLLSSGDPIVLQDFAELTSTGTYGEGDMAVSREIIYNIPVFSSEKSEFIDRFEDKSKWEDSSLGSHEIQTIDGADKALKVTDTSAVGSGDDIGSLIALKWSETSVDLGAAHKLGNKYFLSYDTQVKVGFTPLPVPNYYMAGITFRLDSLESDANYYGLSFLRGDSLDPSTDKIPDQLVPPAQKEKTTIVLWQKTNSGSDMTWLAYKDLSQRDFSDDVESGPNGWSTEGVPSPDGLWHISSRKPHSGSNSWYYGKESTGTYNTGATNRGSLESPDINLCGFSNAKLSFWSWYKTEPQDQYVNSYDLKYVYILDQNGNTLKYYQIICPGPGKPAPALPADKLEQDMKTWNQFKIDLSLYVGQIIKVRFYFNTRDAVLNDCEGWYIDDVTISGDFEFPVNEATLMVRIIESASITFNSGGATPIEDGDNVVGSVSGASGTVSGTPIIESGSWTGNDAAGTILLKNVSGTFVNEPLIVIGSMTSATVTDFIDRANYIRAYYGDTSAYGMPDGSLLDDQRDANLRNGDIHWPPDEVEDWSADNDYFTLVQWDDVNTSGVPTVKEINSLDEPYAIIQSDENELLTPTSGIFDQPEIGLHTFGTSSTRVYFDDFGLQTDVPTSEGFLPAVQQ
jgi:hypothetical protein